MNKVVTTSCSTHNRKVYHTMHPKVFGKYPVRTSDIIPEEWVTL